MAATGHSHSWGAQAVMSMLSGEMGKSAEGKAAASQQADAEAAHQQKALKRVRPSSQCPPPCEPAESCAVGGEEPAWVLMGPSDGSQEMEHLARTLDESNDTLHAVRTVIDAAEGRQHGQGHW